MRWKLRIITSLAWLSEKVLNYPKAVATRTGTVAYTGVAVDPATNTPWVM